MIIIISPSKTMDTPYALPEENTTKPQFEKQAKYLASLISNMSLSDLMTFMSVSDKIAKQNYERFQNFSFKTKVPASPAVFSYTGEVYSGLQAKNWSKKNLNYAQEHLRILSGLYGSLKPKDKILPYRLEMAARFHTDKATNLYQFWKDAITKSISEDLKNAENNILINLASDEYFKVIDINKLKTRVVNFQFFEIRQGKKTFVSFSAKRARGLMASFIITNEITDIDRLKVFDDEGYYYDSILSKENNLVFCKVI